MQLCSLFCWPLGIEINKGTLDDLREDVDIIWERIKFWVVLWVVNNKDFRNSMFPNLLRLALFVVNFGVSSSFCIGLLVIISFVSYPKKKGTTTTEIG